MLFCLGLAGSDGRLIMMGKPGVHGMNVVHGNGADQYSCVSSEWSGVWMGGSGTAIEKLSGFSKNKKFTP